MRRNDPVTEISAFAGNQADVEVVSAVGCTESLSLRFDETSGRFVGHAGRG